MTKNDGGTAFPMQDPQAIHAYAQARTEAANSADVNERDQIYLAARAEAVSGMSLRDYFAAKCCAAMVSTIRNDGDYMRMRGIAESHALDSVSQFFAQEAYKQADAMLAARVKP